MSLLNRFGTVIVSKLNNLISSMEDPREAMDYAYEKNLEMLKDVKRSIVDIATVKSGLQLKHRELLESITKYDSYASSSIKSNNEDLARKSLETKFLYEEQSNLIKSQLDNIELEQSKLIKVEQKLSHEIELFKVKKDLMKAQYTSAEAQVKINESIAGISNKLGNLGESMERAKEKTDGMIARSNALNELMETGVLNKNTLNDQLIKLDIDAKVNEELNRLKGINSEFQ